MTFIAFPALNVHICMYSGKGSSPSFIMQLPFEDHKMKHPVYLHCNENFGPPAKIGPPGLILAAKSGLPLPISVPPIKCIK